MKLFKTIFFVSTLLSTMVACGSKDSFKPTKIAIFADNQLTSSQTGGGTAFSHTYVKNHLKLCKEENVDVIMISGDLVNNAVDNYYKTFEGYLKEIYGSDESKYPEFVYTMGNHEWYTNESSEKQETNAVKFFAKHARIDTKALRKKSTYELNTQSYKKGIDYYKVVNGIPFLSISGCNESGMLAYSEMDEIKSWLNEISNLASVKAGGPIFVSYHYAIKDVTYSFGQGASSFSVDLDSLLKNYPQAIVFTGDTHFAGANERTINQVDYTTVNLGSSCYSRHVARSVTMNEYDCYYNIANGSGSKDTIEGEVANNFNKTPHIHIVTVNDDKSVTMNRYFSTNEPTEKIKLGLSWNIPAHNSKDKFIYTSARYQNKVWAQEMYQKDGLSWKETDTMTYKISNSGLTVEFPDCIDFNYCEHYRISVTGNTTIDYDFISHYYKWESNSHNYKFTIKKTDLPQGDISSVKITAFDYFDNQSLNILSSDN